MITKPFESHHNFEKAYNFPILQALLPTHNWLGNFTKLNKHLYE